MMFINSIFLPKTLSDQSMPDGKANGLGGFSHLFSNVFRFVKEGQESSDPIQIISPQTSSIESLQNELLKVSLSADNKIIKDNSSISMIVSLFVSQFRPGDTAPQKVENSIADSSENAPKYFSLSKDDLVTEIKNLFSSLEDINVSQSGNAEISLITNGIITPLNFQNISADEIENLIASQVNNKNDFKLSVKIGNQTLTLDVEAGELEKSQPFDTVEIITENKKPASNSSNEISPTDKNQITSKEDTSTAKSSFQPQLQGVKQDSTNLEIKAVSENKVELKSVEQPFLNKSNVDLDINQSKNPLPVADKINKVSKVPDQNKLTENNQAAVKDVKLELNSPNVMNDNVRSADLKMTDLSKTEKKIHIKSNQKLNSFLMNNISSEEKIKLSDLADKTEVKEIKIDVQNFVKKNSITPNLKAAVNHDGNFLKPDLEKHVKTGEKPRVEIPNSEVKTEKQLADVKTFEVKSNTTNSETVKKFVQNLPGNEVRNNSANSIKLNSETIKFTQQELFSDDNKFSAGNETTNKTEIKTETKSVTSEWFKNKTVDAQRPNVKESDVKPLNQVETKTETAKIVNPDSTLEYADKEKVVKSINDQRPEIKTNQVKISAEKVFTQEKEIKLNDATEKISNTKDEKIKIHSETAVKEIIKPLPKIDLNPEEVKVEAINHKSDVKVNKENTRVTFEVKNLTDLKENNAVKIDFKERRVYSQIPKLEVVTEDNSTNKLDIQKTSSDQLVKEKSQLIDEPVKTITNQVEQKPKEVKQVWVKVSVEKNETENSADLKKSNQHQHKITIDADDVKKEFSSPNYSQDEQKENLKYKHQTSSVDSSQNTDTKSNVQTQNNTNQQEVVSSIKPEHKTDQSQFRSELHNENVKYSSRAAEMVEKVKVISSGEMVREVYKVLENGEKQSIVLKLVPKELGAIKVMLDTVDNVLTAKVEVESETVGQVIRNNVEQLKHNLLQSGVHVNSISISYSSSQQKQHGFNNQKKKNGGYQQENDLEEVDEAIITKKLGYNTYEYLA